MDGEFSVPPLADPRPLWPLRPVGKDDVLRATVNTLLQYISERFGATELTFVGDREARRQGTRFNFCLVL